MNSNEQRANVTGKLNVEQLNNTRQVIYRAPVAAFTHVDYIFRAYPQSNLDICQLKNSVKSPMFNFYKEFVFRFYRLC
jgi:hypothetical protein